MKVNMDKIRQYEGSRKNIIQIVEYFILLLSSQQSPIYIVNYLLSYCLFGKKLIPNTFLHNI